MANRWKWLLLAFAAVGAAAAVATDIDMFGAGSTPWYGWWDALFAPTGKPFEITISGTAAVGAAASAGLRTGDTIASVGRSVSERRSSICWIFASGAPSVSVALLAPRESSEES